jgi:hypothetical protein
MVEDKKPRKVKEGKIFKIKSLFSRGWKNFDKIASETGAAVGTVRIQYYKYRKLHGEPKVGKKA